MSHGNPRPSAHDTAGTVRDDGPMTTPRRLLVDPVNACDYHLVSRCVQGAFLCGRDRRTGRDYSHRRQWLVDRIRLLACCFAVEVRIDRRRATAPTGPTCSRPHCPVAFDATVAHNYTSTVKEIAYSRAAVRTLARMAPQPR